MNRAEGLLQARMRQTAAAGWECLKMSLAGYATVLGKLIVMPSNIENVDALQLQLKINGGNRVARLFCTISEL